MSGMMGDMMSELEELRAEVERLRAGVVFQEASDEGYRLQLAHAETRSAAALRRAESAEAERDEYRAMVEDVTAERDRIRDEAADHARRRTAEGLRERNRADRAEAERDALQQQVANATAPFSDTSALIAEDVTGMHDLTRAAAHAVVSEVLRHLRAALGGPAAPSRWDEETDALFVDAARRAGPTPEPQQSDDALHGPSCDVCAAGGEAARQFHRSQTSRPNHLAPTPEPTITDHDGFAAPIMDHAQEPHPCGHVQRARGCGGCDPGAVEFVKDDDGPWQRVTPAEPVERITDDRGDELEHGADTDAEATNQPQDGGA